MRIGIVNDRPVAVEVLRRIVTGPAGCEVAWIAENGREAVALCRRDLPDLVLMDLLMPVLDGVEATRRIMAVAPCPILVVTATVDGNTTRVYDALGAGALDAVDTPCLGPDGNLESAEPLLKKIRTIARLIRAEPCGDASAPAPAWSPAAPVAYSEPTRRRTLVAIASSTGGPEALATLLQGLPDDFSPPIVIVQHLGASFLDGFVTWLQGQTGRPVRAARSGARPTPEAVLVAAGDEHVVLDAGQALAFTPEPRRRPYRPSADVFFHSLASHSAAPGVAVVLTGMGRDGAQGLLELRRAGWSTLAQDRASSVVYGMPRAAAEADAAEHVVGIGQMGPAIARAWQTPVPTTKDRPR
ncbi:MAG: chemotaxis-specific protein-glutamate methyltransferase CheB [Planctomycetota bacterium]